MPSEEYCRASKDCQPRRDEAPQRLIDALTGVENIIALQCCYFVMHLSDHLSEDDVELYSLRRMSDQDLRRAEEHLRGCEWCRAVVMQTDLFHDVVREVLRDLHRGPEADEFESGVTEPMHAPALVLHVRRTFRSAVVPNHSRPYRTGAVIARFPEDRSVALLIRAMAIAGFEMRLGLTICAASSPARTEA